MPQRYRRIRWRSGYIQGADGHFTLYEDENDNYNYENGRFSTIEFFWNDSEKSLNISKRDGEFPGMLESRTFHVLLVREGFGTGEKVTSNPDKTVTYSGEKMTLNF